VTVRSRVSTEEARASVTGTIQCRRTCKPLGCRQIYINIDKANTGKATRLCDQESGWLEPDTFGCVSEAFAPLSEQLRVLERDKLPLNTFSAVRVARQLRAATNASEGSLYGTDVLLASRLLHHVLSHENHLSGLNLTHRQDRDFLRHLVRAASAVLDGRYAALWERVASLTGQGPPHLLKMFEKYAHTLASSQRDTFTDPFELAAPNMGAWCLSFLFGISLGCKEVTSWVVTAATDAGWGQTDSAAAASEHLGPYDAEHASPRRIPGGVLRGPCVAAPTASLFHAVLGMDTVSRSDVGGSFVEQTPEGPSVLLPKYNNYVLPKEGPSMPSFSLSLAALGLDAGPESLPRSVGAKAVVVYAFYPNLQGLFPTSYDSNV
ncbi:hypothetical protein HPB47_013620, partial [Ixodes persulcatus]